MYILLILNFIFSACLGVFFFIQLKEREDDIEDLYDLVAQQSMAMAYIEKRNKKKGSVINFD